MDRTSQHNPMNPTQRSRSRLSSFTMWITGLALLWFAFGCEEQGQLPRKRIAMPASPQALQGAPSRMMRPGPSMGASKGSTAGNSVAGIKWRLPKGWRLGRKRRMRVATYLIPGASGQGQCSVFHFGAQGGSDQANIDRWRKQFKFPTASAAAANVKLDKKFVSGVKVTFVSINGTFLWSPRPMSPNKVPRPGYRMLGSIVRAPAGPVFFKCVGPKATIDQADKDFRAMMFSIRKGS